MNTLCALTRPEGPTFLGPRDHIRYRPRLRTRNGGGSISDQPEHQPADLKNTPATGSETPAWLADDPCPPWCTGDHPLDEHPEDRVHMAAVYVPVVRATRPPFRSGENLADAAEYIVTMRRYAGQADTWVYIGQADDTARSIEITVESARRLLTEAAKLTARASA